MVDPPVPSYNVARILQLKQRLQSRCRIFVGRLLDKHSFGEFVSQLHGGLPYKGDDIDEDVLIGSLQGLAGAKLTKQLLSDTAWRLAGNLDHLRNCNPVTPWGRQSRQEWVPTQIIGATLKWTKQGKYGAAFDFQFLAGSPCPLIVRKFWSSGFCAVFGKNLGFTAPWRSLPYEDPRQLVNMRFYAKVDPVLCTSKPGFHEVKVTPGFVSWNKELMRMRYRLDPELFACPAGYPSEHPCHSCPVGEKDCEAAVHPLTFKQRHCGRCRRDTAWFDPASSRRICVDCTNTLRRKGEL
jgi:hypothetical protein